MYARSVVHAGDDICFIGYNESTVMHKKRKCTYKKDELFQSKIGKFSFREPLKIPDSVIRLIEGELYNSVPLLSGGLTDHTNTTCRTTIEKEYTHEIQTRHM